MPPAVTTEKVSDKSWTEYFRIITPFLLLVMTYLGSSVITRIDKIDSKIDTIDTKIFHHLTNEELHIVRNTVLDKGQFDIYVAMHKTITDTMQKSIEAISKEILDIKCLLIETHVDTLTKIKNNK
jgi:hypothetical protein